MTLLTNVLTESLNTNYPFWQAPLPFNLIRAQTAGQISAHGALGMIRIAAHDNVVKLKQIIDAYQTYHDRPCFCFAHHLPQMQSAALFSYETFYNLANYLSWQVDEPDLPQPDHFLDLLETAIDANPRAIGFANGIPNKEIIHMIQQQNIFVFAICHNLPEIIASAFYEVDAVVIQGMEAGGERCHFDNNLADFPQPAMTLLQQARKYVDIPLILWGDLSSAADVVAALISGAHSVMLDRPWIACQENQLNDSLRELAIHAHEFQSVVNYYFTQHKMRYIINEQLPVEDYGEPWVREGYFSALFAQLPDKRPLPISLTPIADPQTISTFLTTQKDEIKNYIA